MTVHPYCTVHDQPAAWCPDIRCGAPARDLPYSLHAVPDVFSGDGTVARGRLYSVRELRKAREEIWQAARDLSGQDQRTWEELFAKLAALDLQLLMLGP